MDKILNGILRSNKTVSVKKAFVEKVKTAADTPQSSKAIKDMIQLTMDLMLNESDPFIKQSAKDVYLSWVKNNCSTIPEFFTTKTVHSLMTEVFDIPENVPWIFHETFSIMFQTNQAVLSEYYRVVEMCAIDFIRRNTRYEVIYSFCRLLLAFKACIPRAQFTIPFCDVLITNISKFDIFFRTAQAIIVIKNINNEIAGLLHHIWQYSGEEVIHASLKTIFQILSANKVEGKDPILCIGGIVKHIPPQFIEPSTKLLTSDSTISEAELSLTLKRVIGWLSWPGADTAVDWMKALFIELRSVGKHDIIKWAIETNIDNVCEYISFGAVRMNNLRALECMLLTVQDSPDPWLKIAPLLQTKIAVIREDLKNPKAPAATTQSVLDRIALLIYCMTQLFPGFPDVYEPLFDAIKDSAKPSPQLIEQQLQSYGYRVASRDRLKSSTHAQVYIQKSKSGKVGLGNLGNTCYMNSVLQAIYMCDSYRRDVLTSTPSGSQLLLVKLQYVFAFLTASHRPFYYPDAFNEASRPAWFEKGCQQDCSEFLRHLLDQLDSQEMANLRDSMKKSKSSSTLKKDKKEHGFSLFKSKKDAKSAPENLSLCVDENTSLVQRTFGGQFLNTYQCLKCNTESTRVEKFNDIALAFPESLQNEPTRKSKRQHEKQRMVGGSHDTGSHVTTINVNKDGGASALTLSDMMENFLAPEMLTGDNKYKCDKCKSLQEAERRIDITQGPEYLILTLLRFSFDLKKNRRTKIFTDVKYPKTLLVPVTECSTPTTPDSSISHTDKKKSRRKSPTSSIDASSDKSNSLSKTLTYGLCAVVVHSGLSSDAGHYYCYARHSILVDEPSVPPPGEYPDYLQDKWYLFNDSRVTYSSYESFSEVTRKFSSDTAYLLFYKKIDLGSSEERVRLNSTIVPQIVDPPLRIDLLNAVDKDNERFVREQEKEQRRQEAERSRQGGFSLWGGGGGRDNHDRGPPPPSCGGGGGMGFNSGPHFVF